MGSTARKLDINKKYSYADYLTWSDDERWELIDGVPYNMSPAPAINHQRISVELVRQIANYLIDKTCEVFDAPVDVRFPRGKNKNDKEIFDVVQPDIIVVCDKDKIEDDRSCLGAPDIVTEILSPSSASRDVIKKRRLYEKNKVKQYWIVDPQEKEIYIYTLQDNGKYGDPGEYTISDKIKVHGFEGLEIDVNLVFGKRLKETGEKTG
ncbi:MAG: Uma2 family endonuclease [Candidatus Eremiobacterota bacterium]